MIHNLFIADKFINNVRVSLQNQYARGKTINMF